MQNLLAKSEAVIAKLNTESELSTAVDSIELLDALGQRVKELKAQHEAALIEYLAENGDIEIGDRRYYVGQAKNVKCNSVPKAFYAMIEHYDGDFEQIAKECLSSNAIKHGAFKTVLGEDKFRVHFTTTVVPDLKTGKPKKVVGKQDKRFAPKKR